MKSDAEGSDEGGEAVTTPLQGAKSRASEPQSDALDRTLPARPEGARRSEPAVPAEPRPGQEGLSRYKLIEEVGQGGMAVVYRARDLLLDREVAVKVLHPHLAGQAESRDRLQREAQAVAKLRHENILEIFDYSGPSSQKSFIVTEFIHGTTLRAFMQAQEKTGTTPHPEIAELIVSEVARALEQAHKAGIIHRDVKPENVMIRNDGVLKLTDFGIAQIVDRERMTVTGQLLGSPAYMAPEHVEGSGIDFRTDIFAVGILLYQLATGQLPFRGKNPHEVLKRIAECVYTPPEAVNPRVGRRLSQVIARALAKDKAQRYADVGELRRELVEDLTDAGLDDTRAELARCFANPAGFQQELGPRLVLAFTTRGRALRASGRRAAALELWRRALEIEPRSDELLALVAGAERQRALRGLAFSLGTIALIGGGVFVGARAYRATRPVLALGSQRGPASAVVPTTSSPVNPTGPLGTAPSSNPEPTAPSTGEPRPLRTHMERPRAPTVVPAPAAPVLRRFELVPTPKAVRVFVDGKLVGDYGPSLQSVELDGGSHMITFDSPFCYPATIPIGPETQPQRLARRLLWKPATLTVKADPGEADIVIDNTIVARSGQPRPMRIEEMSNGHKVVRVKVSAIGHLPVEQEVELTANEAKTLEVRLRATEAP